MTMVLITDVVPKPIRTCLCVIGCANDGRSCICHKYTMSTHIMATTYASVYEHVFLHLYYSYEMCVIHRELRQRNERRVEIWDASAVPSVV